MFAQSNSVRWARWFYTVQANALYLSSHLLVGRPKREAAAFLDKMIKESGRVPTLSRIADDRLFKTVRVRA
jgi:hypothetical protein